MESLAFLFFFDIDSTLIPNPNPDLFVEYSNKSEFTEKITYYKERFRGIDR